MADKMAKKASVVGEGPAKSGQKRTRGPDKAPRKKKAATKAKK